MFIHLHVHSQYSILDASASVSAIAKRAKKFEMSAVALTDHGNLFGAVDFYKACRANEVKPLIGCEVYVAPGSHLEKKRGAHPKTAFHLTLLAKNSEGYHNLCKLSSIGFLEGFYYHPRIDLELLEKHSGGLICLSGCMSSELSYTILNESEEKVSQRVQWYRNLFGDDYYLEMMRHTMTDQTIREDGLEQETWLLQSYTDYIEKQKKLNTTLQKLSKTHSIPLVATNDSHYTDREDWRAHEILLNIQSGEPCEIWERDSLGNPKFRKPNPKRRTYSAHECYFKSSEEMKTLFSDLPEAIETTVEIANKCELELDFETKHYPVYIPPSLEGKKYKKKDQVEEVKKYLWQLCEEGIPKRYTTEALEKVKEKYPDCDPMEVVQERLDQEMSIIAPKGMCDYLLIVWDFIHWAKSEGIPVGPGRGSGAGSIVLYLIGITDIEPLRFNLFFERFINPERLSYPDIDVDICMSRRSEVINYTLKKYGKENVAQIITFGTMKAKMTIKDVGRVLSVPLSKVNQIAKLVPDDLNITLEKALEVDPELRTMCEQDEEARRIIDIGKRLEGSIRNTGIHAAGIVVCGEPLTNHIPICNAKDSELPATQYSMKPVEQVGMLKIDFLGLKTLTCIQVCVNAIAERFDKKIDWMNLPLDNKKTFDLLNQGKTMGVFQLESGGMLELAKQLHLDKFEEIIAVGALYRPGPMDMIPTFINRKHGRELIENDHPWMKEILDETYGIMVYQEQVMQIACKLANYSLGEGDVLRRAMGKKEKEQMAKQREKFRQGALENGIDDETATRIFDKMEKFASYGFNKSHATAYAYLSYVTAYLKANYPSEWMAALMTCVRDDISKVSKFIGECHAMEIDVLPPDVNEAGEAFVATEQGIRFAMSAIKGVGSGVVEAIVTERKKNGKFTNLYDFIERIDTSKVGKKTIECLADAGCFDFTKWSRDALRISVEPMFQVASKEQKERARGFLSLFDTIEEESSSRFNKPPKVVKPSTKNQLLMKEKELLGFFLTGHPMDTYKDILQRLSCVPLAHIGDMNSDGVFRAALLVEEVNTRISSKTQKKFAILRVGDGVVQFELPIWPELYEEKGHLLNENQLLYAVLQLEQKEGERRLSCRWFEDLTQASEEMIVECDRAFDLAKQSLARAQYAKAKRKQTKEKPEPKKEMPKSIQVVVNADAMRHSHVLELRTLFEKHRGSSPIIMDFLSNGKPLAAMQIDASWGVTFTKELESKLKKFDPIQSVKVS